MKASGVLLLLSHIRSSSGQLPNIILVLTDDEDLMLGGLVPMTQTQAWLKDSGMTIANYFVTTPVCCPSRIAMLSGKYSHNLNCQELGWCGNFVASGNANRSFSVALQASGYTTGYFGKYLNNGECGGTQTTSLYVPPGWDDWFAMCNLNKYYAMHWNDRGVLNKTDDYHSSDGSDATHPEAYSTALLGNRSLEFLHASLAAQSSSLSSLSPLATGGSSSTGRSGSGREGDARKEDGVAWKPFFLVVAPHAPHVPATPAAWHLNLVPEQPLDEMETMGFDESPPGHHWLVSDKTSPLSANLSAFSHLLAAYRQTSLLAVDDVVGEIRAALQAYPSSSGGGGSGTGTGSALDDTFVVYTSDHGYALGQFRLTSGKYHVYENHVRAPCFVFGPGISPGTTALGMAANIDLVPTILDLAQVPWRELKRAETERGVASPGEVAFEGFGVVDMNFDGQSLLPLLFSDNSSSLPSPSSRPLEEAAAAAADAVARRQQQPFKPRLLDLDSNSSKLLFLLPAPPGWRDRLLLEYWGCCDANGTYVWRGGCRCYDQYPNQCGVGECGADGVHDALLDAPSNTWLALRVLNATTDLTYVEYRGRLDPPLPEYANFSALYDIKSDPDMFTNLLQVDVDEDGNSQSNSSFEPLSNPESGSGNEERMSVQEKAAASRLEKAARYPSVASLVDVNVLHNQMYNLATCAGDSCRDLEGG